MSRYYLRTFGGLSLWLRGASTHLDVQRKRLALLSLLAAAGDQGIAREKITALLWPESDNDHGLSALYQLAYALRRQLEAPAVVISANVSVDANIIGSDIRDFKLAAQNADRGTLIELYRGPFLDGFGLRGAAEFERWVEQERSRTYADFRSALEALARDAAACRDIAGAVRLWEQAVRADPLSRDAVLNLMNAWAASGDAPAALRVAQRYMDLLRADLELDPDEEFTAALRRIRETKSRAPVPTASAARAQNVTTSGAVTPTLPVTAARANHTVSSMIRMIVSSVPFVVAAAGVFGVARTKDKRSAPPGWQHIATVPAPVVNVASGVIGKVYLVAGSPFADGRFTRRVLAFEPRSATWSSSPPLPSTHSAPGERQWLATNSAVIGARLYTIGGNVPGYCTSDAKAFEPATQRWIGLAPLPIELCHAAVVAAQGRAYVFGGTNVSADAYNTHVFVYEPRTNSWRTARHDMPLGVTSMGAAAVGSTIYIVGGTAESALCTRRLLAFDTESEVWAVRDSMSVPRCNAATVALAGRVYVLGGHFVTPGSWLDCNGSVVCADSHDSVYRLVESYDPVSNTWRREPDLPGAAYGMAAAVVDGRIYAIGGAAHGRALANVYAYQPPFP